MCFSEISSLTFGFQKYRVHTICLTKMTKLYAEIDNSVTNLSFIDVNSYIRKTESYLNQFPNFQIFNFEIKIALNRNLIILFISLKRWLHSVFELQLWILNSLFESVILTTINCRFLPLISDYVLYDLETAVCFLFFNNLHIGANEW